MTSGAALAGGLATTAVSATARADDFDPTDPDPSLGAQLRAEVAFELKLSAAEAFRDETLASPPQLDNDDETRYDTERYYASFSKTLPSNTFGEVDPLAFEQLVQAARDGTQASFDAIPLSSSSARGLVNPQGAFKFEPASLDSHGTRIAPSHTFRSPELAGEMVELYWQALTRDVPFSRYDTDGSIADAVDDLDAMTVTPGEASNGPVTPDTLFRGETPGDLVGPYLSQFLWQDFSFGSVDVEQRYQVPVAGVDFMVDAGNWLAVQRGAAPVEPFRFHGAKRYIYNNRALGEFVHRDVSFQAYLHAALILLGYGPAALDPGNPYRSAITNQEPFTSLGGPFVVDMVTKAANLALTGAWFQKWRVHRFLRPEALAGRIHFRLLGQRTYELHSDVLDSDAVEEVFDRNGTYFLPQAFPEGSPTHPSYPAGHACIAGACVTVLKAFFDEDFVIPDPVVANATGSQLQAFAGPPLRVGDELNKLGSNISLGRDAAGVHYRQDGIQGMRAGEQQAIALLREQSQSVHETNFGGFTLTRFDGTTIHIADGSVTVL